jgi:hypothetical protein
METVLAVRPLQAFWLWLTSATTTDRHRSTRSVDVLDGLSAMFRTGSETSAAISRDTAALLINPRLTVRRVPHSTAMVVDRRRYTLHRYGTNTIGELLPHQELNAPTSLDEASVLCHHRSENRLSNSTAVKNSRSLPTTGGGQRSSKKFATILGVNRLGIDGIPFAALLALVIGGIALSLVYHW